MESHRASKNEDVGRGAGGEKEGKRRKQPNMDTAYVQFIVRIKCNAQYL